MRSRLLLAGADHLRAMAQELRSFGQFAKTDETAQLFLRHATLFEKDAGRLEEQAETLERSARIAQPLAVHPPSPVGSRGGDEPDLGEFQRGAHPRG